MSVATSVGRRDPDFPCRAGELLTTDPCTLPDPLPADLRGAFACVTTAPRGGMVRLMRDPLGINKLFWARAPQDEALLLAARPLALVERGCRFEDIRAVAPGTVITLDLVAGTARTQRPWAFESAAADLPHATAPPTLAAAIHRTLDAYCASLAKAYPDRPVFVCLSGGLDSTGIACLARRHLSKVTAVSFDVRRQDGTASADRITAERLARELDMECLNASYTEDELLDGLDIALAEGIDWRDFNVHAALVNVALARTIAGAGTAAAAPRGALVLTGDLHNEYLIDYHAEPYRGRIYYAVPRLPARALQRALVRGVETSHREVGPFGHFGLAVVQPYAAAVDHYFALPEAFLTMPNRKTQLCRWMYGGEIPDYVYDRPKTRAQTGDVDVGRGVLGVCIDRGIDDGWLRRRFAALHQVTDARALDRFIRAGRYATATPEVHRAADA